MPTEPKVLEQLQPHIVPIDSIEPWPGNPRVGDLEAIAASLSRHGQFRVAVIQKSTGRICLGNHMWQAAKEKLGWSGIAAVREDLSDEEAKSMLLADNRLAEKGSYNDYLLAEFVQEAANSDLGLEGTGYNDDDLNELLSVTGELGNAGSEFLDDFITSGSNGDAAPSLTPFSEAPPASAVPAQSVQAAHEAQQTQQQHHERGAEAPAPPASHSPNVHTGPEAYRGPGAPAVPAPGPELPKPPDVAPIQWVVTIEQRDLIRRAVNHAKANGRLETGADALTEVCRTYLAVHEELPADQPETDDAEQSEETVKEA